MVKNPPANAGDGTDTGSIPGAGRSPGEGYGNPLQYSCLENPMDRGAWRATVHRVGKSRTRRKRPSTHATLTRSSVPQEQGPCLSRAAFFPTRTIGPAVEQALRASLSCGLSTGSLGMAVFLQGGAHRPPGPARAPLRSWHSWLSVLWSPVTLCID